MASIGSDRKGVRLQCSAHRESGSWCARLSSWLTPPHHSVCRRRLDIDNDRVLDINKDC
ncbi:hypothetical protein [Bradyrhizobium sp. Leo121]|uniref:hypothetical protein n=1 Tax=Bradyrhizobium sp. Leo121 TaxID=1571195 RepID=UPI00102A4EEA|nr:hypothetical protein [Bradyrhizobium sp. Leo121]